MQHLLLLHGAIGAKDQLEPLANALKGQFTVHTLNFSGHGGAPFWDEFSIPIFAEEVLTYIQENKLDQVTIFGYSLGGYVAFYLAKQHPERVKRIITLATKFHWDETIAEKETGMLNPVTIAEKVPAFAEQLRQRHLPNDWKLVLDKTKEMLLGLGRHNALQPDDYKTINTPSLLLLGEKDKMVTVEETLSVLQALPHGEFRLLPATHHPVEQVNAELLAGMIRGE